ncbi:type II toxin-antitoxin system HicB family antitoxin [Furfurilactobacillus curtus]|uniref:HicB-like antitoxin of toxin-antitoxin system domain-containing protein n=1 Tax=Furfurilactobacillus curtus TaxID=1746200 RepID=A0ABQ5JLF9_9LACO
MQSAGERSLEYYMGLSYQIVINSVEEGSGRHYFALSVPDLTGLGVAADTISEGIRELNEAKRMWFATNLKLERPIPEPSPDPQ